MGIGLGGPPPTDLGLEVVEDLFVFHMLNVYGSLLAYSMVPTIKNLLRVGEKRHIYILMRANSPSSVHRIVMRI